MKFSGFSRELQRIINNLDPVAGREAQNLITAKTLHRELACRISEAVRDVIDGDYARD